MDFAFIHQDSRLEAYTRHVLDLFDHQKKHDLPTTFVNVAIERAVDAYPNGLTYGVPPTLMHAKPGHRVKVPLGRSRSLVDGTIIEMLDTTDLDPATIRMLASVDDAAPPLPSELLHLAHWISAYYACPIGMTLAGIVPGAVKRGAGRVTRTFLAPTPLAHEPPKRLGPKQKAIVDLLTSLPASALPIDARDVAEQLGLANQAPVKRLLELGLVERTLVSAVEAALRRRIEIDDTPVTLSNAQTAAVTSINAVLEAGFSTHLLFGVTGSGKTEVYLRLLEQTLAQGKSAIILVPEIALAAQTIGRVLARFPTVEAAVLHSGLTPAQRNHAWARIASGDARLILGARSAIFAPLPDTRLGLLIVDEEHDASFKQDQAPRYNGRDAAIRRAQLANCPIILGSATPSLESWHNACEGRTTLHRMPDRAPGLHLPRVEIIDFAEERRHFGSMGVRGVRVIGPRLAHAINETLSTNGQVLLLLNRRGYANYIACPDQRCGWIMNCDHCDSCMVCHQELTDGRRDRWVRCHHCDAEQQLLRTCPLCSKRVTVFGQGTQRVEEELLRLHPSLAHDGAMVRVDSDAMRPGDDFDEVLQRFRSGAIRLLCGTQMIAKGLDVPGVRLVGVVNADTSLNFPDFRAGERTFQLVSQVVGRCGRGSDLGTALIQTFQPETLAITKAATHDFEGFAEQELRDRTTFGLPPIRRMVRFLVRDGSEQRAWALAEELHRGLERLAAPFGVEIRPPSACPIARVAGRYRVQLESIAMSAAANSRLLADARSQGIFSGPLALGESVAVDVDPVAML